MAVALVVGMGACAESTEPTEPDRSAEARDRPLRPLVYTEDPDHSPEAAAVRDRRLMRQLLEGSDETGSWGELDEPAREGLPALRSAEKLGSVIYRALIEQSDRHWDHLFVPPGAYASLVEIDPEKARRHLDDKQAAAREARRAFEIAKPSEAPSDGLESLFSFERLELGDGRTLQGNVVDGDEQSPVQHWNNRLVVGLADSDVEFHLEIRKILRTPAPGADDPEEATRLGVASEIDVGSRLETFLAAGMHLKPSLLRGYAFPFPLEVGNYWRYARHLADEKAPDRESTGDENRPADLPDALHASRVTMRVEGIERYGARRLVHLRFIYNDADLTRRSEYWLATPRRIYLCRRPCRRHVEDLEWLLRHLRGQTPIFRFPLARDESWQSTFSVDGEWHSVDVPGGSFFGTFALDGLGPLEARIPFHRPARLTRFFAPSKGVVRRRYRLDRREPTTLVESLVDYRIMPR